MSPNKPKLPNVPKGGQTLRMESPFQDGDSLKLDEPYSNPPAAPHMTDGANLLDSIDLDEFSGSVLVPPAVKTLQMKGPPPSPGPSPVAKTPQTSTPGNRMPSIPPPMPPQAKTASQPQMAAPVSATHPPMQPKAAATAQQQAANLGKKYKITSGLIGHILVQNNILTEQQRDMVLKLQVQSGNFFKFGELAVKNGYLTKEVLAEVLKAQRDYVTNVKKEQSRMIKLPEEVAEIEATENSGIDEGEKGKCVKWLVAANKHGASDLHVMAGQPLIMRHTGKMLPSKQTKLSKDDAKRALLGLLTKKQQQELKEKKSYMTCLDLGKNGRARGNIFHHMDGMNGAFRLIPPKPPSLVALNLPSNLAKFTTYAQGLVLITGPIGCGKTTTMAALVDIVNRERRDHVITIERPIEHVHKNHKSIVTQREVGQHTTGFAKALRAALREDPDVIAVGEMNDIETARLTISAAETGHLVFATLHTDNAVRTINRALDIFPPDEQNQIRTMLAESLRGVICQRLVKRNNEPGLVPVVEMLFTTPAMRNLIREKKVHQMPNAIKMSRNLGNRTFADYAEQLKNDGIISNDVYESFCSEET